MRVIEFYRTDKNKCPVESFFDSLSDREVEKILWILKLIRELDRIPKQYFKKILSSQSFLWASVAIYYSPVCLLLY